MKEFTITKAEEGRRLDKYIMNILKDSPRSFTYKMLRKKNIVLNGKKASGQEILSDGDTVRFYLADDTFDKFSSGASKKADSSYLMPDIVYEDKDLLIVNKPSGMLTQKSNADDISLNEICLSYVNINCSNTDRSFTPSVCNRLDRNTSGLVTFAKTYRCARCLSEAFRKRTIHKYYKCVIAGKLENSIHLTGTLIKDETSNTVKITDSGRTGSKIETVVKPVTTNGELTMAEVELITGKTHQIRAHLAYAGHPIIGDVKYGDRTMNDKYRRSHGIDSQMLVCYRLVIPDDFEIRSLASKTVSIDVDKELMKVM